MPIRRPRPGYIAPWMTEKEFSELPKYLPVRLVRIKVGCKGFRSSIKFIVTTHMDPEKITADDISHLYRKRWDAEVDLRSIKALLGMDVLRCKNPAMVRKEIWTYLMAYNLLRVLMSQSAYRKAILPCQISFRGTQQILNACRHNFLRSGGMMRRKNAYLQMLDLIGSQTVGKRPDRYEPRVVKRVKKAYARLSVSRASARCGKWKKRKGS